jgi:hypothetical protein
MSSIPSDPPLSGPPMRSAFLRLVDQWLAEIPRCRPHRPALRREVDAWAWGRVGELFDAARPL